MYASMPTDAFYAEARVLWTHIDGPLMSWAGQMHWLTFKERLLIHIGWLTEHDVACARFPTYSSYHPS